MFFLKNELKLLRNSIFAVRGRPFKTDWIRQYFRQTSWYDENPYYDDDDVSLQYWEEKCVESIRRKE